MAVLWIARALLSGVLAGAGGIDVAHPLPELAKTFAWTAQVSPMVLRLVGVAELAAAVALVVPPWNRAAAALPRVAAMATALAMTFATVVHLVSGEMTAFRATLVLSVFAALVAAVGSSPAPRAAEPRRPSVNPGLPLAPRTSSARRRTG